MTKVTYRTTCSRCGGIGLVIFTADTAEDAHQGVDTCSQYVYPLPDDWEEVYEDGWKAYCPDCKR